MTSADKQAVTNGVIAALRAELDRFVAAMLGIRRRRDACR